MKRIFGAVSAVTLALLLGAFVAGASAQTLAEAVDQPTWTFTTGGDANWFGETTTTHDGSDAAQSGAIADSQTTWVQTINDFPSAGYVTFFWKVSSEEYYSGGDYLKFYIDDMVNPLAEINGEVGWQQLGFPVSSGSHTLKWTYSKNEIFIEGSDTAWVDQVAFVPGTTPYTLTVASASPATGVGITVSPADRNAQGNGTTQFTRSYYIGATVTLTAPLTSGGNNFISWSGCDSVAGVTCTVTLLADRTVTAQYSPVIGLAEAVDQPTWTFATGGNADWFGQNVTTFDGSDAGQSGIITDNQTSWMATTRNFTGAGYVTFEWKVSSEEGYDYLTFLIDDVEQEAISGEMGWPYPEPEKKPVYPVSSGTHTLKWVYSKDISEPAGSDTGWVDQVQFTVSMTPYTLTVASSNPSSGALITVSPVDRNGLSNGTTPFTRSYFSGSAVTLTAVSTAGGNTFISWTGCTRVTGAVCEVTVTADSTVTANYLPTVALAEAVDQPTWLFTTSGDANWYGQTTTTHDGADAAHSGVIADGQTTLLATTRDFASSGDFLTFYWKVSSENVDYLKFYIDGVEKAALSGEVPWRKEVIEVGSGSRALLWAYEKDSDGAEGSDAGWVDQVQYEAATTVYTLTVASLNPATGVSITVSPADRNAQGDGMTSFTRSYYIGTTVTLTAPATASGHLFASWLGCESVAGRVCTVRVVDDTTVQARYSPEIDLAEAVDQPTWTFATGGNAVWFGQNVTTSDGSDAGQSGIITDNQTNWIATTRNMPAGGGYLTFSWKVSSEQFFDLLTFLIDDIEQAAISGETAWQPQRFHVGSGAHTFRWAYSKDVNQTEGLDTGWVDGIRLISRAKNDFDGDGRSDIGCYYPTGGNWYGFNSTTGFWQTQFGYEGTLPITGDFDGDGKTDFGCYYAPLGKWYVYKSTEGFWETQFGYDGTIPVVGDFDGDGRDDIGCYYATGGNWYVYKSTEGFWQTTFGYQGTIPVVGDFDGDGRDDIGCYYAPGGNWYVFQSTEGFWQTTFGYQGTIPVVGDFDGDGKDDIGCYYAPGGNWYVFQSTAGFWQTQFGYDGTEPVVGDFDGDGKDDIGCYFAAGGNWYVFQSTAGFWQTQFGYSGTIPLGGTQR